MIKSFRILLENKGANAYHFYLYIQIEVPTFMYIIQKIKIICQFFSGLRWFVMPEIIVNMSNRAIFFYENMT